MFRSVQSNEKTLIINFNSEKFAKMQICVCTVTQDLVIKSLF